MYLLLLLLFLLAFASFVFQMSLQGRKWAELFIYIALGIGLYKAYPYAIEQSYSKFQADIANKDLLSNFMVLQIVECLIGILFCIYLIRDFFKEKVLKLFRYFTFFPGIIVVPAFFYLESLCFLSIPGVDFQVLAIAIGISFPLLFYVLKKGLLLLIPEYDLRLELKFILHILQLALAVVISIKIYALPVPASLDKLNYTPMLSLAGLVLIMGILGVWRHRYQIKKLTNK